MSNRYYTIKDVASILKCDPQQVRTKCRNGDIPAIKPTGVRDWRIPIADMESVLGELEDQARARYRAKKGE